MTLAVDAKSYSYEYIAVFFWGALLSHLQTAMSRQVLRDYGPCSDYIVDNYQSVGGGFNPPSD